MGNGVEWLTPRRKKRQLDFGHLWNTTERNKSDFRVKIVFNTGLPVETL